MENRSPQELLLLEEIDRYCARFRALGDLVISQAPKEIPEMIETVRAFGIQLEGYEELFEDPAPKADRR